MTLILLLLLQLSHFALPTADISWASRVVRTAKQPPVTIFVVTYPAPVVRLTKACIVLYSGTYSETNTSDDFAEVGRHCWAPHTEGDFDVWENLDIQKSGLNAYGFVSFINMKGETETHYAYQLGGDS